MVDLYGAAIRPLFVAVLFGLSSLLPVHSLALVRANSIIVGLDADMSAGSAKAGEAIRRGILLAIDEINAAGGVLGRALTLKVRDHRGNPARGVDNMEEFAKIENLAAVVGGLHTPVALAELKTIHRSNILFLVPWAAGTPVVDNGYSPNYVFRVSVRDQHAGGFLVNQIVKRGFKRPGLLLERTGWGRSNEKAMTAAIELQGLPKAPVAWFNWGTKSMSASIEMLARSGVDVVLLVANAPEGKAVIREMARRPRDKRLPIVSHWGITGGNFFSDTAADLAAVDLTFLQTYSFFDPPFPGKARRFFDAYCRKFGGCSSPADVIAPVGTAHAYDLIHLLKQAIDKAGTIDREKVRAALETLERHEGLVRIYDPPFTRDAHDALDASDFRLCRFDRSGAIVPVSGLGG